MKPIAVQRSWEKNSRVGRSFWLLSRIGQRFGPFRKGRVKRTEPQRPLSFWGSFSPASKTALGKRRDRKSTRLNSSHGYISYAVFCLKKKKKTDRRDEFHNSL